MLKATGVTLPSEHLRLKDSCPQPRVPFLQVLHGHFWNMPLATSCSPGTSKSLATAKLSGCPGPGPHHLYSLPLSPSLPYGLFGSFCTTLFPTTCTGSPDTQLVNLPVSLECHFPDYQQPHPLVPALPRPMSVRHQQLTKCQEHPQCYRHPLWAVPCGLRRLHTSRHVGWRKWKDGNLAESLDKNR